MPYRVELTPKAADELEALPKHVQRRVARWLDLLSRDPRYVRTRQLVGKEELRRLHVGKDHVVYTVRDTEGLVLVVRIADRKDVYRGL
jgi:mRNA interferase RelE/StbE